ncbi:MAG: hypothetical protein RLZZ184_4349, partial [Cyanobacteriota bacterium]
MVVDFSILPLGFQFTSPGPILVKLGPIVIRWYGLLIASAVLIGVTLSQYLAKRRHVNPDLLNDLSIWLVIASIPAARLYYVLFQWSEYSQHPEKIIAIWEGEKLTKAKALETSGIKTVYWLSQFPTIFKQLMAEAQGIYLNTNEHLRANTEVETREDRFIKQVKVDYPAHQVYKSAPIL